MYEILIAITNNIFTFVLDPKNNAWLCKFGNILIYTFRSISANNLNLNVYSCLFKKYLQYICLQKELTKLMFLKYSIYPVFPSSKRFPSWQRDHTGNASQILFIFSSLLVFRRPKSKTRLVKFFRKS